MYHDVSWWVPTTPWRDKLRHSSCQWKAGDLPVTRFISFFRRISGSEEYRHHSCANMIKYKVNNDFPGFSIGTFLFYHFFGNMWLGHLRFLALEKIWKNMDLWLVRSTWWVCESRPRDLGDVKQRKMNDRILKHMTQPSYWPSSSASRKGTSSRSCAIDIIDMKSTKIKRWMLSMNLNNSQKVLLDPFKCLLNTCLQLVLSW